MNVVVDVVVAASSRTEKYRHISAEISASLMLFVLLLLVTIVNDLFGRGNCWNADGCLMLLVVVVVGEPSSRDASSRAKRLSECPGDRGVLTETEDTLST